MTTGEAMETTDPKSNERTETGSGQGNLSPGAAGCDAPADNVRLEKLSAQCPSHGTVPVVCPHCAGKAGGKARRGTRSRRKKELKALDDACRVLDVAPEARMLEDLASERKEFQDFADKMGWTKDERELMFTCMFLADGMKHLGELSDSMGLPPEERATLREDMQKSVALALGNPDEVPAILERYRRKE